MITKILLALTFFENFRAKKKCNSPALRTEYSIATIRGIGQILAGVIGYEKKASFSATNNSHCDIAIHCLVVER